MRPSVIASSLASTLFVAGLLSLSASADEVVLRDGKTITTSRPYTIKGKQAIVTKSDGTVLAVPLAEIDVERTRAANSKPARSPDAASAATRALTPAEAALAAKAKSRKATVVLTDEDISHPFGEGLGGPGAKEEGGEGKIDVGPVTTEKTKTGYTFNGSLINSGKAEVGGVSVTIEAIGESNKTIATTFGNVAKDLLGPGEKSTFTAEIQTDANATNFRYVPRWQVKLVVKPGAGGGTLSVGPTNPAGGAPSRGTGGGDGETGKKEAPKPEPAPPKRPDYVPPTQNAPVGQPTAPGGTYLPQPSASGQPKPPGS